MNPTANVDFSAGFTPGGTYFERLGGRRGLPLVFVHGLGCDVTMWTGLHRFAAQRTVLSFDLLGHGRTRSPTPHSFDGYVAQLSEMAHFNGIEQCALVGFSLGADIANAVAVTHPRLVRALVLSNVPFRRRSSELDGARERMELIRLQGLRETASSMVERWFPTGFLDNREDLQQRLIDMLLRQREADFLAAYSLALSGDALIEDSIGELRCPVMVLGGTEDSSACMEGVASLAASLQTEAVVFDGAGHMLPLQCNSRFADEVIRFLENQCPD